MNTMISYGTKVTIVFFASAFIAQYSIAESINSPADDTWQIPSQASYGNVEKISENARQECGLERSIPEKLIQQAERLGVKVNSVQALSTPSTTTKFLSIEIDKLIAGRGGSGFGGRWVVSELNVKLGLFNGEAKPIFENFSCTAGLGANFFANLRACDRLERCSNQITTKAAQWLRLMNHALQDNTVPVRKDSIESKKETPESNSQ